MKFLIAMNVIMIIFNLLFLIGILHPTKIVYIEEPLRNKAYLQLNTRQCLLESALINLQRTYWNSHPRDRKQLIEYVRLFADEKASKKITTKTTLR